MKAEEFIEKAKQVHGDKYDYSKTEYINAKTKVCIICPEHGEFWQRPSSHLGGDGCPVCGKLARTLTQEEYIKRAKTIHGDKYDYSKVEYKNMYTKIRVICPSHGEFLVEANNHLKGCGCKECFKDELRKPFDEFIKKAREIHGDKYDYSKVGYINYNKKVCIICPEHGEFWQTPGHHLNGHGCPSCAGNNRHTNISFIEKAKKTHGDKYDYSKVNYINISTKVCIICPEHGEFWITPNNHLRGEGCPKCKKSSLENIVEQFLEENKIKYVYNCNSSYFKFLKKQHLDFYLPEYNVAIECQGEQHYYPVDFAGKGKEWAQKKYEQIKILDKNKKKICTKHKIKLIYFGVKKYRKNVLTNTNDILNIINEIQ